MLNSILWFEIITLFVFRRCCRFFKNFYNLEITANILRMMPCHAMPLLQSDFKIGNTSAESLKTSFVCYVRMNKEQSSCLDLDCTGINISTTM